MENSIQHTTIEGQRWDNIAKEYYGRADKANEIIKANPGVPVYDVLPGGIVLNIPIIEKSEVITDAERLPPWKQ